MDNPRVSFGWSNDLWAKIESGTVEEGMTKDQVRLSWGPPNRVDQSDDGTVWVYGTKVLTFTDNELTSIEDVEGPTT